MKKILALAAMLAWPLPAAADGIINPLGAPSTSVVIGTTAITGGTTEQLLKNNGGVIGEVTKGNSCLYLTNGSGVASCSTTLPNINIGTPSSGTVTNLTGTASININGTVGATTPAAGTFTAVVANSFVPNLSTVPSNGLYLPASNTLGWAINSAAEMQLTSTALSPAADGGSSLGTTVLGWQNLFGNTGFVFNIEAGDWVATHTTGILTVGTGDLRVTTAGTNSASVVTVGGTQTLTSKTLSASVASGTWTNSGTWTLPAFTLGGAVASNGQSFTGTIANLGTVTTAIVNGGTINGTVIGGTTAAAGTFTTLTATSTTTLATSLTGVLKATSGVVAVDTTITSGTYTPLLTNSVNLTGSAVLGDFQYMRVGNTVTVSGWVSVDPTGVSTTDLGISLPIASNFANYTECAGVAFASAVAGQGAAILADTANDRAIMRWIAVDVTSQAMAVTFTYKVI